MSDDERYAGGSAATKGNAERMPQTDSHDSDLAASTTLAAYLTDAIRGEPVSEFGESFPAVREAMDLRADYETLDLQAYALESELHEVNAELDKHGAPAGQRAQARIRAWAVAARKAAEDAKADAETKIAQARTVAFRKLPPERRAVTKKIKIGADHKLYVTVGLYEDGTPGEIFLKMEKQGSMLSGLMDAFAISCSLALKQGVPLEKLCAKFQNLRFEPSGMTGIEEMPFVTSPIDAAFKWISLRFLCAPSVTP